MRKSNVYIIAVYYRVLPFRSCVLQQLHLHVDPDKAAFRKGHIVLLKKKKNPIFSCLYFQSHFFLVANLKRNLPEVVYFFNLKTGLGENRLFSLLF